MKKIVVSASALFLALGVLTGCGEKEAPKAEAPKAEAAKPAAAPVAVEQVAPAMAPVAAPAPSSNPMTAMTDAANSAATAMGDAAKAAVAGVAGGLSSASAVNYAGAQLSKTVTPATLRGNSSVVCDQTALGQMLTSGWPTGYTVQAATGAPATCAAGGAMSCSVIYAVGATNYSATAGITCY